MEGFYNPRETKVRELLRNFSTQWADDFEKFAKGEIKDALDSLVENKNKIAHSEPSGVGVATVRPWVQAAVKACDYIDTLMGN